MIWFNIRLVPVSAAANCRKTAEKRGILGYNQDAGDTEKGNPALYEYGEGERKAAMKIVSLRSLRKHITVKITAIILLMVFPLNVISIYSSMRLAGEYENQILLDLQNITDLYMNTLDLNIMKAHMYMYEMITGDEDCVQLKMQRGDIAYKNARYRCYVALTERLRQEDVIDGYFYLMKKTGDCVFAASGLSKEQKEDVETYIKESDDKNRSWYYTEINGEGYLIRIAKEKDFRYGAVICLDQVLQEIQDVMTRSDLTLRFTDSGGDAADAVLQAHTDSQYANLALYAGVTDTNNYTSLLLWMKILIAAAFIMLLAIPVIYVYLRHLIIKPLNSLNEGFYQMRKGNRGYKISETTDTLEFQAAYDSYNQMMGSMENLRLENMEKELEKKKLEVNNLQLQIRPHFLLNTFNMMYGLCTRKAVDQVQELILYLSDYFRYIFRSGKDLEIFEKEINLIEGYMRAARIRYSEGVTILYQIEPEVRLVRIPPLLIHNFIENAVSHGRIQGKTLNIVLAAMYEEGTVVFQISDDGNGMEQEQVRKMNERGWWEEDTGKHIGIKNAIRRLKYFYGETAGVSIESVLNEGTTVTIQFPYRMEDCHEPADCE